MARKRNIGGGQGEIFVSSVSRSIINPALANGLQSLEQEMKMPVWLLAQASEYLDEQVSKGFYEARRRGILPKEPICLVIDLLC